ncbi:MAG: prepilin-type N-terminal cleavage/methylation domain-containing protein [Candidatus Parcubacteria bacterium]|nr:prepilin-type N-terminal cleavage/methylation domain-containing protein [Candidatus Parcubacteria bacterium]
MNQKGFTLIELLIVIGILVVLMGTSLVAINPFKQFAQANDANRWSGLTTMVNAIYQNVIDNRGVFTCAAGEVPATATIMGNGAGQYDICSCIVPTYLGTMPYDPQNGSYTSCSSYDTNYNIFKDAVTGRITVEAPSAQLGAVQVTR